MNFTLLDRDKATAARTGKLITAHGEINTPVFMPVGTAGTVKAVHQRELKKGNRNRATLAVARRLVAYMMSVDKNQKDFAMRGEQKAA